MNKQDFLNKMEEAFDKGLNAYYTPKTGAVVLPEGKVLVTFEEDAKSVINGVSAVCSKYPIMPIENDQYDVNKEDTGEFDPELGPEEQNTKYLPNPITPEEHTKNIWRQWLKNVTNKYLEQKRISDAIASAPPAETVD